MCRIVEEQLRTITQALAAAPRAQRPGHAGPPAGDAAVAPAEAGINVSTADLGRANEAEAIADEGETALTEGQAEIWLATQFGAQANAALTEMLTVRIEGPLEADRLVACAREVLDRHDALRCRFAPSGETFRIAPCGSVPVTLVDLSGEARPEAALAARLEARAGTPFDLVNGPCAEAELVRLDALRHVLVVSAHHIVCDGWSFGVLTGEIALAYRSGPEGLEPAPRFRDLARDGATDAPDNASLDYWRSLYAVPPEPLGLPVDHAHPPLRGFQGDTISIAFPQALTRAIKALASGQGQTLTATLLATFQVLLSRLAGQDDLVVGVPVAGQPRLNAFGLVGHCVDFLPLRAALNRAEPFAAHLARTGEALGAAMGHADCTLGRLLRTLDLPRNPARPPLAQVQFTHEPFYDRLDFGPDLRAITAPAPKRSSTFELTFSLREDAAGLTLDCTFNRALFDATTIMRWIGHYRTLLGAVALDPQRQIGRIPLLDEEERRRMLVDWNDTATSHPLGRGALRAFALHARQNPNGIAIVFRDRSVTYRELDAWADRVAEALVHLGLPAQGRVGLLMQRGPALVAAMLGALRAGMPYVPLDPVMPPARRSAILRDAQVQAILTVNGERALVPEDARHLPVIAVDRLPEDDAADRPATRFTPVPPDWPAYLIYTSSSTGPPKGVEILHRGLSNLLFAMARRPGLGRADRLLAVTTVTFDIAGLELLLPLIRGARIVLASADEARDGPALLALMERSGVTLLQATPMTWRLLLEAGFRSRPGLTMLCGGEALPVDLARRLLEGGGTLWNMYGPTETTIWSSAARIAAEDTVVTVGRPIDNTSFFIVDEEDEPVPVGVTGELLIGGVGLATGYLGRPDLTARSFIENRLDARFGARLYRTGDRARYLPDGRVQILGRADHQIKLRGYRIEPGEIEAVLFRQTGLHAVVVLGQDPPGQDSPGEERLICYVVRGNDAPIPAPRVLRAALACELPDYMIPSRWVPLSELPLTASGKVNRRALPPPDSAGPEPAAPDVEDALARIWRDVLGHSAIERDDDLIALGGDSLSVFRITARARRENLPLTASDLFQARTIANVAALLQSRRETGEGAVTARAPIQPIRRPRPPERSVAPVGHAWGGPA